jgi:hypothetical protein
MGAGRKAGGRRKVGGWCGEDVETKVKDQIMVDQQIRSKVR